MQDVQQKAAVGAFVALVPSEDKRPRQTQYYRTTTTDQYGRFLLRNVVPGTYNVFAWEDADDSAFFDFDFVKPLEALGQPIVIQENTRNNARLNLIPAGQSQWQK